jgi:hypothetical protein
MYKILRANDRGKTIIDWLKSYHSFSFGEYYDPTRIHFGPLRVINDDTIQPDSGFPMHQHRDMEIVTVILEGTVTHSDSTGSHGTIKANEIQRMTAGSGILHSEFNSSDKEILKLLQIWIVPNKTGLKPSYEQVQYSHDKMKNKLLNVVSGKKKDGIISINQDVDIFLSDLDKGKEVKHEQKDNRGIYIHIIEGSVAIDGNILVNGDAIEITESNQVSLSAQEKSKLILFDVTLEF